METYAQFAKFFLEWEKFQTKVVKRIKHTFYYQYFLLPENRTVYEIILTLIVLMWRIG